MSLAAPRVVNIKDLRRLARARLPDAVFDYLDGAADDEVTLKDSEKCFQEVLFKPRFAVATPACDLGVTVLGHKLAVPYILAPIGYSRLMHPRGELAASAAARAARHRLYSFHFVRPPARGCEGAVGGPHLLSALSGGRPRRRGRRDRPRQGGRLQGAVRHHRHAGGGNRERDVAQRHEGADGQEPVRQAALPAQHPGASALAGRLLWPMA